MPHPTIRLEEEFPMLCELAASGDGAPPIERKLELVQHVRGRSPSRSTALDRFLVEQLTASADGLHEARGVLEDLKQLLENVTAPPWHPAILVRTLLNDAQLRAVVVHNGTPRLVNISPDIDAMALSVGDEVFLSKELNVIVGTSPEGVPSIGETARFDRYTADRRLVLKYRDEELIVRCGGMLGREELQAGDQVRWDRQSWIAFERVERADGKQFLVGQVPQVSRDQVGGQDHNLESLTTALTATLIAPEMAQRYRLPSRSSILLWGPPGVGKTLMARIAAAEVTRLSGQQCRIAVVKPGEFESPWVGETQANIRNCFAAAAREAQQQGGFTVLFLDEIESIGRIRGATVGQHSDKFLAALLAELDGFAQRSHVAVIAATNRKDLVDPALLERLSDVEIAVRRPTQRAAQAIFSIHLPESLPFLPNGSAAASTRQAVIETAVSHFYSPNADNELCVLKFRDGKTRTVAARELVSGRIFEQVCRAAGRRAFWREVHGGEGGIQVVDMDEAVADTLERMATTLSPRNAHAYIGDLPQDVDVVSVEPVPRKLSRPHRYVN